jgi:hypothetical protein
MVATLYYCHILSLIFHNHNKEQGFHSLNQLGCRESSYVLGKLIQIVIWSRKYNVTQNRAQ